MGVAQRHARPFVAEKAGDHRQRNALQHGMAGVRVSEVMKAHVFDPGFLARQAPERQVMREGPFGTPWRGEDVDALRPRLPLQDGARRRIQKDPPRSSFGIRQIERVTVHVLPAQGQDLALAAAGQQQKADGVRLPRARRPRAGETI